MFPAQRRDVSEKVRRDGETIRGPAVDDLAELHRVPEYDDGGEQVHAGNAIMLPFAGSIPDFAASMETDGAFQGMMGLALVEADPEPGVGGPRRESSRS